MVQHLIGGMLRKRRYGNGKGKGKEGLPPFSLLGRAPLLPPLCDPMFLSSTFSFIHSISGQTRQRKLNVKNY